MKTVQVRIEGVTPLLIHRFGESAELNGGKDGTREIIMTQEDPRSQATKAAYIDDKGHYYFNAFAIPSAMGAAGSNHKVKGSRKTLRFVVPSSVCLTSDTITILNGDGMTPADHFEVDSRPVTIPATKGKIMRHRPRFNQWSATFDLQVNERTLPLSLVHQLLNEAGESIGIGDFRPEKRGPFGRFRVTSFEEVKGA